MKVEIKRIEKHETGSFYMTVYFEDPTTGEELRTKLSKDHLRNLISKGRLPKLIRKGLKINVCGRKGRTQTLYYIYGYEEPTLKEHE